MNEEDLPNLPSPICSDVKDPILCMICRNITPNVYKLCKEIKGRDHPEAKNSLKGADF